MATARRQSAEFNFGWSALILAGRKKLRPMGDSGDRSFFNLSRAAKILGITVFAPARAFRRDE
jgi:hypothetical protein